MFQPGSGSAAFRAQHKTRSGVSARSANGASSRVRGFGDLTFGPGLQWAPKKIGNGEFVHRFVFDVTAPTGTYNDSRPVNIGNNFGAVDPYYAVTYERKKIEFRSRVHYLWSSTNDDPYAGFGIRNMQPGQVCLFVFLHPSFREREVGGFPNA